MTTHSAHDGHGLFRRLLPWNWMTQSEHHTDETPAVQPFRIIHQDEARREKNRFLVWCDNQPSLHPRFIEETGPKTRESIAGLVQKITPQVVEYKPREQGGHWEPDAHGGFHWVANQRTTDGIQQVAAPHTPIPEAHKEAERVQKFDPSQLPEWIQALRNGSLLVPGQESATEPPKDAMLMTMRPGSVSEPLPRIDPSGDALATAHLGRRSQPLDIPDRTEVPTLTNLDGLVLKTMEALPPFIGGGEMPAVDQQPFPEHSWVNSVMSAPIEVPAWVEPQPSALVPLNKDAIAAQDRIVVPHLDDDDTLHVLRAVKPMKESEG